MKYNQNSVSDEESIDFFDIYMTEQNFSQKPWAINLNIECQGRDVFLRVVDHRDPINNSNNTSSFLSSLLSTTIREYSIPKYTKYQGCHMRRI